MTGIYLRCDRCNKATIDGAQVTAGKGHAYPRGLHWGQTRDLRELAAANHGWVCVSVPHHSGYETLATPVEDICPACQQIEAFTNNVR